MINFMKPVVENQMLSLFSIPVGRYKIDRELTKKEMNFFLKQPQRNNLGNTTSTNFYILNQKELTSLRNELENKLQAYFEQVYSPKYDVSLRITQSWVNYTKKGQFHHKHRHPNSFISGVYYIETTDDDRIYFHNDRTPMIEIVPNSWNNWNSKTWWIEAKKGSLVLFPSLLEHNVEVVNTDETRISLSFNTFPIGDMGEEMDLTGLKLEE